MVQQLLNSAFSMFGCVIPMQALTETWLPRQMFKKHGNEKRQYAERSNGDRTGNVHSPSFHDTEGMADECVKYHSRLAELIANKKGESFSSRNFPG